MSSMVKPIVIEISSSSEDEETKRNWSEAEKGRRRRYSDVEVKTEVKRMEEEEEEEEDCCILPFDPLADDLNRKLSLCGAQPQIDDLSIVAERGQVACRDYPHSRHLCAELPFSMTSRETCCPKCYCYVCDDPAPCKFWKGPNWHCHASDQDKKWKEMRELHGEKKGTKEKGEEWSTEKPRRREGGVEYRGAQARGGAEHRGSTRRGQSRRSLYTQEVKQSGRALMPRRWSGAWRSLNAQEMEWCVEKPQCPGHGVKYRVK